MPRFGPDRQTLRVLVVLAIAQVIAWGTIGLLTIVGRKIADDLQMTISMVFSGTSVLYVVMGLLSPVLAKIFARFGARFVMIIGTLIAAPGFGLLAASHGPILYFAAWGLLGMAGSATLSTAAYIMLNEVAGQKARGAIGALMLVTGLSSSAFLPLASFLEAWLGWRGTCLVYAALMLLVCLPLYCFGLPRREGVAIAPSAKSTTVNTTRTVGRETFYLIAAAVALNSFVTFGFASILVELLKALGLQTIQAVAFGSLLGVIQVGARAVDFIGGGRWDGLSTGLFAGVALPVSMCLLMLGGGAYWSIAGFILFYGLGSGALAVARATIPLVFYDKADYAQVSSHIALPLNLMSALAPPILAGTLTTYGSGALLALAILCSCGALGILRLLARRRPLEALV